MKAAGRTLAQAKVNLALRVLGRNADGYHSIETVFLRLDLSDAVTVRATRGQRSLRCDDAAAGPPTENLAFLAADLFARETGWPEGFEIEIEKRIPISAGLGGGSADAAAVLRILNTLSSRPLTDTELLAIAGRLGADVPFLTSENVMALAWGRGEIMRALPPLPSREIALFVPERGMSTAAAYANLAASRGIYAPRPRVFTPEMFASWENVAIYSVNDFEPVVMQAIPEVLGWLSSGERFGTFTRMTGSGSCVFQVFQVSTQSLEPEPRGIAFMTMPEGSKVIRTRTAESVVPVEILD